MDRNSEEYKRMKAEYEAEDERRKNNPKDYPWFMYQQFGWHMMKYISDAEKDDAIGFYKGMFESKDTKGHPKYERFGRQPITIMWTGDRKVEKDGKEKAEV